MYFFDTYAIIEIAKDSAPYREYQREKFTTTIMNLFEVYYILSEQGAKDLGSLCLDEFLEDSVKEIPKHIIMEAMDFRLHRKDAKGKRFSYIDAIGYTYALESGIPYLTGDGGFKGFPNVEFVR